MPESEAFESFDAHRVRPECPEDLSRYFTELSSPRVEVEAFVKNPPGEHDLIGTTYLHPDFTLGSVNIGDLWNQRRPLLAYWNTDSGVLACRLRCLHDGYDYASASIFTVQDEGDILGAVVFATDRGDTHISLDRLQSATITAKDLRIRLQFEGSTADMNLPPKAELGQPIQISSGRVNCAFHVPYARFGNNTIETEVGRDKDSAWIDVILYRGAERQINFNKLSPAIVVFALSAQADPNSAPRFDVGVFFMEVFATAIWDRIGNPQLYLGLVETPTTTDKQRSKASAKIGNKNHWQSQLASKVRKPIINLTARHAQNLSEGASSDQLRATKYASRDTRPPAEVNHQ